MSDYLECTLGVVSVLSIEHANLKLGILVLCNFFMLTPRCFFKSLRLTIVSNKGFAGDYYTVLDGMFCMFLLLQTSLLLLLSKFISGRALRET